MSETIKLYVYSHTTKSGNVHLRVKQPPADKSTTELLREKLHRVGSPATWLSATWEWDYPLTIAAVSTLQAVARELNIVIEYSPEIVDFAKQQEAVDLYEDKVRLAMEKIIRDPSLTLDSYVTDISKHAPLRHQQIAFHWGTRVSGLFLAHDPGCIAHGCPVLVRAQDVVFWCPIQCVQDHHLVWDGNEWVAHGGVVSRGERKIYRMSKCVWMTDDHMVFVSDTTCIAFKNLSDTQKEQAQTYGKEASNAAQAHITAGVPCDLPYDDSDQGEYAQTYDIKDCGLENRFLCGDFIVHNCGKTRSAIDISRGWYDHGIIRPMEQVWLPAKHRWGVRGGLLTVCPNQMQDTWIKEFAQWQHMLALAITGYSASKKRDKSGMIAHAHVINYESLKWVDGNEYDGIILDEIHRCANHTDQMQYSFELAQRARRRVGLSGTPVANKLESVFYPMLIIDGGRSLGASKQAFIDKYFEYDRSAHVAARQSITPKAGAVEAVSKAMARCTYFLRKEEALDLPQKTHTPISIRMTDEQRKYYESVKKETLTYIQDSSVTVEQAAARMMKLRQVCQGFVIDDMGSPKEFSSAKIDFLVDALTNTLYGRKVVIWAVFTYEIDRLCVALQRMGIGYVRLDGTVTSKPQRRQALDLWNNNPRVTVFIGQIQMGIGITLHANECEVPCYECVYLAFDWSYVNWTQSQDRIHRIGQKYPCTYRYLLAEDGVDERIYEALQNKANTTDSVYKVGKEFFRSLLTSDTPNLAAIA